MSVNIGIDFCNSKLQLINIQFLKIPDSADILYSFALCSYNVCTQAFFYSIFASFKLMTEKRIKYAVRISWLFNLLIVIAHCAIGYFYFSSLVSKKEFIFLKPDPDIFSVIIQILFIILILIDKMRREDVYLTYINEKRPLNEISCCSL